MLTAGVIYSKFVSAQVTLKGDGARSISVVRRCVLSISLEISDFTLKSKCTDAFEVGCCLVERHESASEARHWVCR